MYKICIWTNIASPHQIYFFKALSIHPNIDLQVRYFEKFHDERTALGWKNYTKLPDNEQYVVPDVEIALDTIDNWRERIHIIPGLSYEFIKKLLDKLIDNNVMWIHWSERSGIVLASKIHYNVQMFNLLHPFISKVTKKVYASKINKYAMGVFAQGKLAEQDFIGWGVQKDKIEHLYYTIGEMKKPECLPDDFKQYIGKRIFLYAGSLDERKGIKVLLNAFSILQNKNDWLLVLVGQDKSFGEYKRIAKKLGVEESVIFTGSKEIEVISQYIGSSDVFILPTLFDGWGAVLNEAAALGRPIISTDQCGAAFHLIEEGKNGFRVKAGNIHALANSMQYYIDNQEKLQEHGKNSEQMYLHAFTPEKNVIRLLKAIDKWSKHINE